MSAYRSSLFQSLKKEVSEKLPQYPSGGLEVKLSVWTSTGQLWRSPEVQCRSCSGGMYEGCGIQLVRHRGDCPGRNANQSIGGIELCPRHCCWCLTRLSGAYRRTELAFYQRVSK